MTCSKRFAAAAVAVLALAAGIPRAGIADAPAVPDVAPSDDPVFLIGRFPLKENGVVDGDTFKVEGLDKSLRLICIDTEETPKRSDKKELLALMEADFPAYVEKKTAGSALPVKFATPLGLEATTWAEAFLADAAALRLERDFEGQGRDTYGRWLCFVWAEYDDGRAPQLYNLEAVRAGMAPYFTKYGRTQRFHEAFVAAQAEAKAAARGIWSADGKHYPDYDRRIAWWTRRAEALDRFAALAGTPGAPVSLGEREAIRNLLKRVGEEVSVFGIVDDHSPLAVAFHEDGCTLKLGGSNHIEIEIVSQELVDELDPLTFHGEFLKVTGRLDRLGSPLRPPAPEPRYMRIAVTKASQITRGDRMPVGAARPRAFDRAEVKAIQGLLREASTLYQTATRAHLEGDAPARHRAAIAAHQKLDEGEARFNALIEDHRGEDDQLPESVQALEDEVLTPIQELRAEMSKSLPIEDLPE